MKMMRALLVLAAAATCGTAYAQGGWDTIGTRDVGWNNDRDTIPVRGAARYRQIRLCAFGGPVHMMDLDVRFANGGHQDVNVRSLIRAGSCTRNIDLNGQDRNMTSISVLYERARIRWRRNPQVRVQAR
jgi:hypothetical protein